MQGMSVGGRYKLQYKLGEGGMGEVYAALDRLTGTTIALKRVLYTPQDLMFSSRLAYSGEADLRRMLANEFRVLASLRHPHIISVLDYGFDSKRFSFYTMTLLENARTLLQAADTFSVSQRINAFAQMLQALAYLHRRAILHRDLKPANVLVDAHNTVKLLDFGLSTQENTHSASGTLAYMPPEIIRQGQATAQSDLYSIGLVAYELFARRYAFNGETPNELIDQLLRQMPDMGDIPQAVSPIITRLIMKDPADRYPDADAALHDLAAVTNNTITVEDATLRESFLQAAGFVGRERELALLTEALDRMMNAQTGGGNSFLIGGESGVGKSRLIEELRTHALLNGALLLRGQCIAESGQPFQMWQDVVRRLVLESDVSDLEAAILGEIVPDISDLLGREITPVPVLRASSAQSRLVEAILGLFQHQAQPIVLILEDLHWAMESLIPLQRLIKMCAQLPLLIVGSYRNDEVPTLPTQLPEMQPISLGRLTIDEIADLSKAMIGARGEQDTLIDYLHQQSEGNVFFLVEVIRALAEDAGNLRSIGTKTLPQQVFAGGIERLIAHRLQRLPVEAAPALQLAAVAGRNIDETLLRWLVGEEAERWLQAGMNAAILEVVDAQWRFAHDRLRDAVIRMIPPAQLPHYHQHIAQGLETLYPDKAALASILYEHWRAAGNEEKEAYYAVMVMEQRLMLGILNEASQMLEKILLLKPQTPELQLKFYVLAGEIYFDLGKPKLSAEAYTESMRLAQQMNRPEIVGQALEGLGNAMFSLSEFDTSLRWYQDSLNLRRSIQDLRGAASSLHFISVLHRFRGNYPASWQALEESIALRRQINDLRGLGDSLYQMSLHARNRGDYAEAIGYLQEGIALRRTIAEGRGLADDLNSLGICYTLVGEYEQAYSTLMESLSMRYASDNQRGMASCQNALGEMYIAQQNFGKAIRCFGVSLKIWIVTNDRWNIANCHVSIGYTQARAGEILSARHHLYEGLEIAHRISALLIVLKALIGWAQIALHTGNETQAAMLLGTADHHPAMTAQARQIYFDPVAALLDVESYAEEYTLGKNMELQGIIRMILSEAESL